MLAISQGTMMMQRLKATRCKTTHLDTTHEAELATEDVFKGNQEMLYCNNLDAPPENILQCFSVILGDLLHPMHRFQKNMNTGKLILWF